MQFLNEIESQQLSEQKRNEKVCNSVIQFSFSYVLVIIVLINIGIGIIAKVFLYFLFSICALHVYIKIQPSSSHYGLNRIIFYELIPFYDRQQQNDDVMWFDVFFHLLLSWSSLSSTLLRKVIEFLVVLNCILCRSLRRGESCFFIGEIFK